MRRTILLAVAAVAALFLPALSRVHGDVPVTLSDWSIAMPTNVSVGADGRLTMEVTVDGRAHHNLTICPAAPDGGCAGPPVRQTFLRKPSQARDPNAVPDATTAVVLGNGWDAALATTLQPGATYRFYCSIVGHAQKGMQTYVTVTDGA
jgi:uncharacterized cupredoxin-like copper-binding protein